MKIKLSIIEYPKGSFNNYVDKMMAGGGQKMSFFVHAYDIKNVHSGVGGIKKWQNSVHVVVECPLMRSTRQLTPKIIQTGRSLDILSRL